MLRIVTREKNSIARRCEGDEATRARLRYQPWYHAIERQSGARVWVRGREMIMLSSNDYLGLSDHPEVVAAGERALREWGSSTTGARLANGSRLYHLRLEEKLADFLGKEACQVTAAGYLSCMSAVGTFARKGDLILVDRNVHSSLWSGIQLTGARVERFSHNRPEDLQDVLAGEDFATPKMLVVEGVYSMEGHVVRLPEMVRVLEGHNGFIVVDDAHGFGVLGETGAGTCSSLGVTKDVDVICGSMSKALSSTGGYVAGSKAVIEFLRTHSKQTVFSAAISPSQAACAEAALDLQRAEPEHRERLWDNTRYYKQLLGQLGVDIWESETPAVPIVIGQKDRAYRVWRSLFEQGIFTVLAVSPAVPPGKDLIRTAISARHTREDLERVVEALRRALKRA